MSGRSPNITPWDGMTPRRWQREAYDAVTSALRTPGASPLVVACTGGGKSHLLAAICRMAESRCSESETIVVSTPTQNLVRQLSKTIASRCRSVGVFYGDRKQPNRTIVVTCNASLLSLAIELAALGKKVRGLVCDEAHSSESPTLQAAVPAFAPKWRIGLTATPFRSDDSVSLSLWTTEAYRYRLGDALEDGVLVPWQIDRVTRAEVERTDDDVDRLCAEWVGRQEGPGVVSARSIADAEAYAAYLLDRGIAAAAIHSELPARVQAELLQRLEASSPHEQANRSPSPLHALVHVSMLAEGVDLPWLRWIVLRRPVSSKVRVVQEFGRVLRAFPGKDRALVYDPHGVVTKLDREAALGLALDEGMLPDDAPRRPFKKGSDIPVMPRAKAVDEATAWTTSLVLAAQAAGVASRREDERRKAFETMPSTPAQHRVILGNPESTSPSARGLVYFTRFLPESVRESVKTLCASEVLRGLQYGAVSDIISVLDGLKDATAESRRSFSPGARAAGLAHGPPRAWRWPAALDLAPISPSAVDALRVTEPAFDWNTASAAQQRTAS
jgi:DNA repair protein RadD